MKPGWKKLAERADKAAYQPEEISAALDPALRQECRDGGSAELLAYLRKIFGGEYGSLFPDAIEKRLHEKRQRAAGNEFGQNVIDCAIHEVQIGGRGDAALQAIVEKALIFRAQRGTRQVEEHYLRKSNFRRASWVRDRIAQGIAGVSFASLARELLTPAIVSLRRAPAKKDGLDDGVSV
jgi:hypothetical protein